MKTLSGFILFTIILLGGFGASAGERTVKLAVKNMYCVSCPYIVKRSLEMLDGVMKAQVSYQKKTATVTFDDAKLTVKQLTNATSEQGYPSEEIK